jgi:hypothetical protein
MSHVRLRPLHVIRDHQIEFAVAVVIHPRRARAEIVRSPKAGLSRHVGKRAVAIVAEEMILTERGDENIVAAIVVVIADRHAHSKHLDRQASFRRHVGKGSVVIVVIKRGMRRVIVMLWPIGAVYEENVLPAVVVVIEKRHAGAHRLRQKFLSVRAVVVREMNSRRSSDVFKVNRRRRRRFAARLRSCSESDRWNY